MTIGPDVGEAARERRRDAVIALYRQGYGNAQIARALGVAPSSVSDDLTIRLGHGRQRSNAGRKQRPNDPPSYDWRDPAAPRPRAPQTLSQKSDEAYKRSTSLQLWRDVVRASESDNAVNRLSHDALDAERAGDGAWFDEAHDVLTNAFRYLARLETVLLDEQARKRGATDWQERDDLAPLRIIK